MKSLFHDAKVGGIRQQALFTVTIGLTWYSRPANTPNGALHVHTQRMRNNAMKRPIDILVLSDLHLGTYGCRAKELTAYLRTVKPRMVVLNVDIIDIWQFKKSYFPKSHMQVLKRLLKMAGKIPVY